VRDLRARLWKVVRHLSAAVVGERRSARRLPMGNYHSRGEGDGGDAQTMAVTLHLPTRQGLVVRIIRAARRTK